MNYVTGDDRAQPQLLPPAIEDYVESSSPARVIDSFVDSLDFTALKFLRATPASFGRPSYDPRDLLKLYIYGYFNEVRSSRRLERECKRNLEVMWLVRRLAPDHKTIADFRRDNSAAIIGACRAFVLFCRDQGLFTARLIAIDGAKFRAAASPIRIMDQPRIAEEIEKLDARIAGYLAKLDETDVMEPADDEGATAKALAALQQRRTELNRLSGRLERDGRKFIVDGEPDARPMGFGRGGKPPSYNVQTAVDADTGFIVHHDVTDEINDTRMLYPMAASAKRVLEREQLTVVADAGFSSGACAAACEVDDITACVPANRSGNPHGDGFQFDRSAFTYEADTDRYICPAGRALLRKPRVDRDGLIMYVAKDCSGCALKPRCTQARYRTVSRHQHEDALERMTARVMADPSLMRQRRCSVEHPFGTMKRMMSGRFLTRGIRKARTEMALSVLAYNILRSINIRTCPG